MEMEIDLCFTAKMDRAIIEEEHYIVPGGFCFTFDNGDEIEFDFCNSRSCVHDDDATSVTFLMEGLDTDSFPGSERLYEIAKKNKIVKINECFVYCGEKDEKTVKTAADCFTQILKR